jgi:hypothetical protein
VSQPNGQSANPTAGIGIFSAATQPIRAMGPAGIPEIGKFVGEGVKMG